MNNEPPVDANDPRWLLSAMADGEAGAADFSRGCAAWAGADARARDKEDLTPLHMAAYTDKPEHARLLLEAGADVDAKSAGGRTPLSLARKARADKTAGIISLWVLKGCQPGKPC